MTISLALQGNIHAPRARLSADERARRQEAVDYARASIGLEGFTLSQADEDHARRFINGEIDLAEYVAVRHDAAAGR